MVKKFLKNLANLDLIIAGTALTCLIFYTFFGVIMRYFVKRPVYWGEEFQLLCMVVIVLFGAGAGFRTGSHIAIDFIVDLFSLKLQKFIIITMYLISMFIIIYFFIQSSAFARQMFLTKRSTNILNIPFSLIYSAFPLGCILIVINYSVVTYVKYFKPKTKEVSE